MRTYIHADLMFVHLFIRYSIQSVSQSGSYSFVYLDKVVLLPACIIYIYMCVYIYTHIMYAYIYIYTNIQMAGWLAGWMDGWMDGSIAPDIAIDS